MNSQELFEQMKTLFTQFETEHNGTKKLNKSRARKAIGDLKKLITAYRQASTAEQKAKYDRGANTPLLLCFNTLCIMT